MMRISRPHLLELAAQLEEFSEWGVFTAEHRWQTVVDAAAALRSIVAEDNISASATESCDDR